MTREEYKADAKAMIDALFRRIDSLEQRKNEVESGLREKVEKQLADLRKKEDELRGRYAELSEAGAESWDDLKSAFSQSAGNFQEAVTKISSNFKQ